VSHRLPGALLLAGGLMAAATGADTLRTGEVRDLYFGEVLFQFYQDEHFTALNHLLAARDQGRVDRHAEEAELLLGGLYLHYGQHLRAERIFSELLTATVNPGVRNRAWFYLGKVRYQRGLFDQALADLARIEGRLPRALAAELPMLQAQAHMAMGRFDEAAALLDRWRGPDDWMPYARYNLGVALVRLGRTAEGARLLDRVGRDPAATAEQRNLRDQANLALGYARLQEDRFDEAAPVLERVRVNGPFSNKALLGVGWAEVARDNYRDALTSWLTLRERDLLDSAVQESLLAVPYALARLDAHGSAADEYQAALAAYDREIARLDTAIAQARDGALVPAVLAADDTGIAHWYWSLDSVPESMETRYLYHLIADHGFQEGLRNYRDLLALENHLEEWRDKLVAFDDMVETRRIAFAQREPVVSERLGDMDLAAARARRDELAARLDEVAAGREITGLATAAEQETLQWLAEIAASPAFALAPADTRERHRFLKGVVEWELDREFRYRLWQQRQELARLDAVLAESDARAGLVGDARLATPEDVAAFAARIAAVTPRLEQMQRRIAAVRGRQADHLVALATGELGRQRERLAAYRLEAQFALATIYDRAASAQARAPLPELP
jgi:tetratricopeptide (TPR) repeat protein